VLTRISCKGTPPPSTGRRDELSGSPLHVTPLPSCGVISDASCHSAPALCHPEPSAPLPLCHPEPSATPTPAPVCVGPPWPFRIPPKASFSPSAMTSIKPDARSYQPQLQQTPTQASNSKLNPPTPNHRRAHARPHAASLPVPFTPITRAPLQQKATDLHQPYQETTDLHQPYQETTDLHQHYQKTTDLHQPYQESTATSSLSWQVQPQTFSSTYLLKASTRSELSSSRFGTPPPLKGKRSHPTTSTDQNSPPGHGPCGASPAAARARAHGAGRGNSVPRQ